MVFLRWGKLGMKIFAKRKKIYAFQKRFFYKKRKYLCLANAPKKKEQKGEEVSKTLILSQLITPENTDDDLTYTNMVEIAKTSNENGRRMAYSVVGNQDPLLDDASELDSSVAERIVILPPFGEVRMYYAIGAIVAVILIAGIILIKKKVLKKTK